MTLAHFVYIPGILLLGVVIGYVLGGRAAMTAAADRDARSRAKAARDARRSADSRADS